MPVFGRGRGPKTAPSAEYVAAGGDLALVRVQGAGSPSAELLVRSGGREQRFDALPGPPGDDRLAFPVPLELVRSSGCELRLVADGEEVTLAPPPEVHPELAEARAELQRERERRAALEREVEQRATAAEWLTREAETLRERTEREERERRAAGEAERAASEAAEEARAAERAAAEVAARAEGD